MKRWFFAIVALIAMLLAGLIYAWGVLSAPIAAEFPAWSGPGFSFTFTLCMIFFCLGSILAGILAKYMPAQRNLLLAGALFLTGFALTSRMSAMWQLYLGYGVCAGCASGLAYGAIMAVVPRHFPDRPGLISGLLLMGFGASSLVIGSVFTAMAGSMGWRRALFLFGIVIGAALIIAGFLLRAPESEAQTGVRKVSDRDRTPGQMAATPTFWLLIVWSILLAGLGLAVIGQSRGLLQSVSADITPASLSLFVGLISVCNGLGRLLFGAIYDRTGWRRTILAVCAASLLGAVLLAISLRGSLALMVAAFCIIGLGYGGAPTFNAAAAKQFFGDAYFPINFPIINLNLLVSSFMPTLVSSIAASSEGYGTASLVLVAMAALSVPAALLIRQPKALS